MQVRYQAALRPEGFEVYPSLPKKARAFLQIPYLRDSPAFLQAFSALLLLTKLRSDASVESVGGLVADHRTLLEHDRFARPGVPGGSRRLVAHGEPAQSRELDHMSLHEMVEDHVEELRHEGAALGDIEPVLLAEQIDQVRPLEAGRRWLAQYRS